MYTERCLWFLNIICQVIGPLSPIASEGAIPGPSCRRGLFPASQDMRIGRSVHVLLKFCGMQAPLYNHANVEFYNDLLCLVCTCMGRSLANQNPKHHIQSCPLDVVWLHISSLEKLALWPLSGQPKHLYLYTYLSSSQDWLDLGWRHRLLFRSISGSSTLQLRCYGLQEQPWEITKVLWAV